MLAPDHCSLPYRTIKPKLLQAFLEKEVPKLAQGFTGPLADMLQETPASSLVAIPGMDKLPHAFQDNGIAYIGDAWHPMTPFAGFICSNLTFKRVLEVLKVASTLSSMHAKDTSS